MPGGGGQSSDKPIQGQALFGSAVGAILVGKLRSCLQGKHRLELADDLAARCQRIQRLPEHAPEGAVAGVEAVAAVVALRGFGEQVGGQPGIEAAFQLAEGVGADAAEGLGGAATHGGQA